MNSVRHIQVCIRSILIRRCGSEFEASGFSKDDVATIRCDGKATVRITSGYDFVRSLIRVAGYAPFLA